jgi:hypothetical protein
MGMGYCCGRRAKRRGNKVVIAPVDFRAFRDDNERTSEWQRRKQGETITGATEGYQRWTKEDYERLWALDHVPAYEVAQIMGRSLWAIRHKRRKKYREEQ